MAVIMRKDTLQIVNTSGDTPLYPKDIYLINPDKQVIENVPKKYWVVDGDELREMTQGEKDEYEFNNDSTVFFIDSHTLKTGIDGRVYAADGNAILNPVVPEGGVEYGLVVGGVLVAMDADERAQYDYTHKSTVYLIAEKGLLEMVDATDYELDANAVIGPTMPTGEGMMEIELKFTEYISGVIVEMSEKDKALVIEAEQAESIALELSLAKLAKQATIKQLCKGHILESYPIEKQMSASLGLYTTEYTSIMMEFIAGCITEENARFDEIETCSTVAEVGAVIAIFPVVV